MLIYSQEQWEQGIEKDISVEESRVKYRIKIQINNQK